jgi:amino acid adenylation domain-containing protein
MSAPDSLIARFKTQAARVPGARAAADGEAGLSYAELDRWSDAVAQLLAGAGVERGDLVGLRSHRGLPLLVAIIGVLKLGCGYVPLDPDYPAFRLRYMLSDAGVRVILDDEPSADPLAEEVRSLTIPPLPDRAPDAPPAVVDLDSPAYVIYTSGSTGNPKGVLIRHRNVLSLFDACAGPFSFSHSDVWSLFHSPSFDISVWEMWGAWLHGACVVCVPDALRIDPDGFASFLAEESVTVLSAVPTVFRHLLADGEPPSRLRYVVFGGESVASAAAGDWLERSLSGAGPELVNMYGITETTIHLTHRMMGPRELERTEPGTLIGTPLKGSTVIILDEDGAPVEPGEHGELYVSGPGVADGYLARPELTAARFTTITTHDGSRLRCFRSGDIASWSGAEQSLVHHGRLDHQVQLRGFRIELGEVETAFRGQPGVGDAVAAVVPGADGEDVLAMYVTGNGSEAVSAGQLRRAAAEVLPRHMLPGPVHLIERMPMTPSGKVDRRALPDLSP